MSPSYWSHLKDGRVSRRKIISATAFAAGTAAFLAACGGSSKSKSSQPKDSSTLLTKPVDTLSKAVRGGTLKERLYQEPSTLDVFTANSPLNALIIPTYSTFVQQDRGHLKPANGELVGDIAKSWEFSPDGLTITMKLRPGVKWHNKAPVNGRDFDMDDALFSWKRFVAKSTGAESVANQSNPDAPVLSFTAPDNQTIAIKLKEPLSYALGLFSNAGSLSGAFVILPKETDTSLNVKNDIIGTGPFMLSEYSPSRSVTLKRHPNYYDPDRALVDEITMPIIGEYSAALSQLKAGNIYSMGSYGPSGSVAPQDLLAVKKENPDLQIYTGDYKMGSSGVNSDLAFGWLPEGNLFYDERVRQAVSMGIDRDAIMNAFNNADAFTAAGLPVDIRWSTALQPTRDETTGWWLDPKSKAFGENSKYYAYNIPEGKKLLAAAGYSNGFKITSHQLTTNERGQEVVQHAVVQNSMLTDLGIQITVDPIDYAKQYAPIYRSGLGQFTGWAYASASGGATGGSAIGLIANEYWSKAGVSFRGYSASGKNDKAGDPKIDGMIEKARAELDTEKRRGLVFDIQRELAKAQYTIPPPGAASSFVMVWPCVADFGTYQRVNYNADRIWIDKTKPPFKS